MATYPSGTVTFLFTDIEGSTRLARELGANWEPLRQHHHAILNEAMNAHGGYVFQIIGDAFCVTFNTAGEALQAASKAQKALFDENWGDRPIRVRMGIHTGKAEVQDNGQYVGYLTLSRVQRILSAGYGGQTLLSQVSQELVRDELPVGMVLYDLGEHRLKDLIRPEHIYQLNIDSLPIDFPPIKTLDAYRHNLPVQMTSFIGREREMAEIKQALAEHRLVILTGPGGAGKTRLSMQVAADLVDRFKDGVWFIDLAPLSDPAFIPQAIAAALNVREEGATPLSDSLINHVKSRQLLILLDNCEHLVEACARIVDTLLQAAPHLKILATGREALGVAGEKAFSVPSLPFAEERHPSVSSLSQYDATRLFIDRALLVQPHFTVTNENAPAVAQICYRLDGIPLAIELAAARVKAMSPEQIASRLDDSFRLLTGGSRTALPRQQTLRATIDWSWGLTTEAERKLLGRLSVFAGGWTLEAAEKVCIGEGIAELDILDLLTLLVSKSLVVWHEEDEPRYQLLETIRQYAHTRLSEAGDENRVQERHAEFFAYFAEQASSEIYSPAQARWMKRLDKEKDNLRAALEWHINSKSATALRVINALGDYLWFRDAFTESIQWFHRALEATPEASPEQRAYALFWMSIAEDQIGQFEQALQHAKSALELARQVNDKALLAHALFGIGTVFVEVGDPNRAIESFDEAVPLARETQLNFVLPGLLAYVGMMHMFSGEFSEADAYFQESIENANRLYSEYWKPMVRWFSGSLALQKQDIEKARSDLTQGLQLARERQARMFEAHIEEMLGRVQILDGNYANAQLSLAHALNSLQDMKLPPCLAHDLEGWARLALAKGEPERATRILGGSAAHLKRLGATMVPIEQALYDQTLAALKERLDDAIFQQEWAAGEKLNTEQTIELATR